MATVAALATADPMADSNAAAVRGPRHPHGHEHPFAMPAALTASPPAHGFLAKASPHHGDAPLPVHGHAQHHHGHHHGPYMHAPMGEYALAAAAASAATAAARGQSSPPLPPPSSTSSSGQPHADMHGLSGDAMPDYLNAALAVGGADGIHGPLHHGPHVLHGLPTNPLAATSPTATSASSRATATAAPALHGGDVDRGLDADGARRDLANGAA
ncbi:hypothetical protein CAUPRSCDRAFT_12119 [Caulochytrium protostelioides]|uniref:Uncharacterized protein n=1 Tax=Caulochytrium protostelioides TaxID=1555241 RepID=A0A4P9WVM6_9FUNG|nr:hypothetical protein CAUPRSCDRAFT_12119 [Caulochytrium protostelioides]